MIPPSFFSTLFNTFFNNLLLFILYTVTYTATRLPLNYLRILAKLIGILIYVLSAKHRKTIASNLTQAQLNLSIFSVNQAIVCGAADMLWVWLRCTKTVAKKISISPESNAAVHEALNNRHATILLTPHLGCFEALAKWIAHQTPLTAMYRRPKQKWVAQFIESVRNITNLTMARADTGGVRVALKTLKSNGLLGILPDQVPKQGEGLWLPWFGRDAYTINLPAKLHLATQARMYIIYAIPNVDGWQVHCERIVLPEIAINSLLNEAEAISRHLNSALECVVKRHSLYYAWGYKRYKHVLSTVIPT